MERDRAQLGSLGLVQRDVRLVHEQMAALGPERFGEPDADGSAARGESRRVIDLMCERQPVPVAAAGQESHELVAAGAIDDPCVADGPPETLGDLADVGVARRMPVRVVDLLQPVEVDRHQRQHGSGRAAVRQCVGEVVMKRPVVAEVRQVVGPRLPLELFDPCVGRRPPPVRRNDQEPSAGEHREGPRRSLDRPAIDPAGVQYRHLAVDRAQQGQHDDHERRKCQQGTRQRSPRQGSFAPQGLFLIDSCSARIPPIGVLCRKPGLPWL